MSILNIMGGWCTYIILCTYIIIKCIFLTVILTIAESASSETGVTTSVNPLGLGLEDSWRSSISEMSGNGASSRTNEYCICPELALVGGTKHVRVALTTSQDDWRER